jgi:hypothetical protein
MLRLLVRLMALLMMLVSLEGCFWVVHDFDGYPHHHRGYGHGGWDDGGYRGGGRGGDRR